MTWSFYRTVCYLRVCRRVLGPSAVLNLRTKKDYLTSIDILRGDRKQKLSCILSFRERVSARMDWMTIINSKMCRGSDTWNTISPSGKVLDKWFLSVDSSPLHAIVGSRLFPYLSPLFPRASRLASKHRKHGREGDGDISLAKAVTWPYQTAKGAGKCSPVVGPREELPDWGGGRGGVAIETNLENLHGVPMIQPL